MDKTTQIAFIVFAALVAVSMLIQALTMLGIFLATRKTQKKIHALAEDVRIHLMPAMSASRGIVEDLSPKIKIVSSNLVETSNNVRSMANDVSGVVQDIASRTREQAAHVDGMVQGTLDQIDHAGQALQHGIAAPLRQLNGIISGLRAGWSALSRRSPNHSETETDLFV